MRQSLCLLMLSASALLAACGDSGVAAITPAVTEAVPAEVTTSSDAAMAYTTALSATASTGTDTLEPVAVPTSMATDDTAEPKTLP